MFGGEILEACSHHPFPLAASVQPEEISCCVGVANQ